ncbi:glycosyltransferase family 2 protein [Porifericola rhodea]|uniref:glycosyltransferase family 2 protein n=1 Tax=Porifericola rhodea TaxID=930972 RepID=UPI002666DDD8|nr:glycosyltransferase family 2 protein [Porifericola rhodea]WKN32546.1 glycosyltransferase family 2 protein [Porifericola rhodea]
MDKIAILLTCFNRKDKTLTCLNALYQFDLNFDVFLVDDGSTDGTSDAIKKRFPKVNIISGSGNLFWSRGMRLAWEVASKHNYTFYIWLNDDVFLYPNAFRELLECSKIQNDRAIISGIIESESGEVLYGGFSENREIISANNELNPIRSLNGNAVLVPQFVFDRIGLFDNVFHHDLGDVDYGLRALSNGIKVLSTRVAIAQGEKNLICRERLNNSTLSQRLKKLYSPLGSNPNINFYFRKKHKSVLNAIAYYLFQHFLNIIPDSLNKILFKNKYQSIIP